MNIEPSAADWAFAKSVRDEFARKPGAQHIASEFALAYLGAVLDKIKPRSVLEFGAGIGTISYFLLKHPVNIDHVTTTESNPYCLGEFAANIPDEYGARYDLVVDESTLKPGQKHYDLVIVDDAVSAQGYRYLDRGMICFVEGGRSVNRHEIRDELTGRGLRCDFTNYKPAMRYFRVGLRHTKNAGIPYPKFHLFKTQKGCWIGTVEPALEMLEPLAN